MSAREYFKEAETAIVEYNKLPPDQIEEKNKLYEDKIHYGFYKLAENLIHNFKFYHTEVDDLEHLKHEVEIFLLSKIHLFKPDLGFKAYSYFGTIGKRYLILYNQKNYKKKVASVPIEIDSEKESNQLPDLREEGNPKEKLSYFLDKYLDYCLKNLYKIFPDETDAKVADAVLEIFSQRDNITMFNKKALYIYIRNQVEVKTPKITKIVNKLYDIFYPNFVFYLENDYIDESFPLRLKK